MASSDPTFETGILTEVNESTEQLIECTAQLGDQNSNLRLSIRDINNYVTESSTTLIETVENTNVYPIIIASEDESGYEGLGNSYTLFRRSGSAERIKPASPDYELYRCLSSAPRGIFSIVSGYFKCPDSVNWIPELEGFHGKIKKALEAFDDASDVRDTELGYLVKNMLIVVENYITDRVAAKRVTIETFTELADKLHPYVIKGLRRAAKIEVEASVPLLKKWKQSLGDEWNDTYVVIPTLWPNAGQNPRKLIFERLMDRKVINSHIIVTENVFTYEDAKTVVERVVSDRLLGQLVFGRLPETASKEFIFALSTKRDILHAAYELALEEFSAKYGAFDEEVIVEKVTTTIFDIDDDEDEDEEEIVEEKEKDPKWKEHIVEI